MVAPKEASRVGQLDCMPTAGTRSVLAVFFSGGGK